MPIRQEKIVRIGGWEQSIACMPRHIKASKSNLFTDPHYHEYIEMLYGIGGNAKVMMGEHICDMSSGDLLIVNAGEVHDVACTEGEAEYYVIKFLPKLLYSQGSAMSGVRFLWPLWQREVAFSPIISADEVKGSGIDRLITEIIHEWEGKTVGFEHIMHADIMRIFVWMLRHRFPEITQPADVPEGLMQTLSRVLEATDEHLGDWTAKDAAEFCNLSYSYFSRNFKRAYNISFTAYLESVRLREAERLLLTTDFDITEIALRCGFGTTSYFIGRFRAVYGLSPRRFRMRMRY